MSPLVRLGPPAFAKKRRKKGQRQRTLGPVVVSGDRDAGQFCDIVDTSRKTSVICGACGTFHGIVRTASARCATRSRGADPGAFRAVALRLRCAPPWG